jgi:hypothetical protein
MRKWSWFEDVESDDADLQGFIEDRAHVLNKALVDHIVWRQSLEQFGRDASLAATWIDHEGQDHVVAVNRTYLTSHLKIVRSLMNDLVACGSEGKKALQGILALQVSMLEEKEKSQQADDLEPNDQLPAG